MRLCIARFNQAGSLHASRPIDWLDLNRFNDLVRAKASGTDISFFCTTIRNDLDPLYIWPDNLLSLVVGVAHIVPSSLSLSADSTNSHINLLNSLHI